MDSNNVTLTIKTRSINGQQGIEEIDAFADEIVQLAHDRLTHSTIEVDVEKHRLVRRS